MDACVQFSCRNELRREFPEIGIVASDEEVESLRMEIEHPAERRTESAVGVVYIELEPVGRRVLGNQPRFGIGERIVECRG